MDAAHEGNSETICILVDVQHKRFLVICYFENAKILKNKIDICAMSICKVQLNDASFLHI